MYLDPGFGGMLLQIIVVIAAVGGGIIFSIRKKLRNLFSRNKTHSALSTNQGVANDSDGVVDMLEDEDK